MPLLPAIMSRRTLVAFPDIGTKVQSLRIYGLERSPSTLRTRKGSAMAAPWTDS